MVPASSPGARASASYLAFQASLSLDKFKHASMQRCVNVLCKLGLLLLTLHELILHLRHLSLSIAEGPVHFAKGVMCLGLAELVNLVSDMSGPCELNVTLYACCTARITCSGGEAKYYFGWSESLQLLKSYLLVATHLFQGAQ